MNDKPIAWAIKSDGDWTEIGWDDEVLHDVEEWYTAQGWQYEYVPLYKHPHPDNLGLAESIIKQQELEIQKLKTIIEAYKIRPRGKSEFALEILRKA